MMMMKPLVSRRPTTPPPHSIRALALFCSLFLLTTLLSPVSANAKPKKKEPKVPPTNCIVCDSLADPICANDADISASLNRTCKAFQTWCYKAEGKIHTFDDRGERVTKFKVDRGCAKPYFQKACVHVEQEDHTNFKVCYCDTAACNWDYDVKAQTVVLDQGAFIHKGHRGRGKSGGSRSRPHFASLIISFSTVVLCISQHANL